MSTLASTRARRENAGNRLQALLAGEWAVQEEELFQDEVGDEEFEAHADEADVFASDFASTDDEADPVPGTTDDDPERTLRREEALAERESRARRFHDPLAQVKRKAVAPAAPLNGERAKRRRVTYAETEDPFPGLWEEPRNRREVRTSTIAQKEQVDTRLKKAIATKRAPPTPKQHLKLSQSDLIELALDLESTNRRDLDQWLEKEEERRRSVLVRRSVVKGERTTWISRTVTDESTSTRYERNLLNLYQIKRGKELDVILGDHVDWTAVPVLPNKRAQLNRQSTTCPITGLPARYKCPHTGIPYANLAAYRIIQRFKDGNPDWRWSTERGAWLSGGERARIAAEEGVDDDEGRVDDVPGWREVMGIHTS